MPSRVRNESGQILAEAAAVFPVLIISAVIISFLIFNVLAVAYFKTKLAAATDAFAILAANKLKNTFPAQEARAAANQILAGLGLPSCTVCQSEKISLNGADLALVTLSIDGLPIIPIETIFGKQVGLQDRSIALILASGTTGGGDADLLFRFSPASFDMGTSRDTSGPRVPKELSFPNDGQYVLGMKPQTLQRRLPGGREVERRGLPEKFKELPVALLKVEPRSTGN